MARLHPGKYIRENVIPNDLSVTRAAEILGIGRPALSNLFNEKAALSPEMAKRLELAFGADATELMQMQTKFHVEKSSGKRGNLPKATKFVPPFLMVKSKDIQGWANNHASRHQLAVLLRKLVHSTCEDLESVDFPGNDDSQRRGWDGLIRTTMGNPWIPPGRSVWEFGTGKDAKKKADNDYRNRTKSTDQDERSESTFVFVTPRRWEEKEAWLVEKRAEGKWRDVKAWDASDLEQWLEQSIGAQAWFDSIWGQNYDGVKSLERCWVEWCADCNPKFTMDTFAEPASNFGLELSKHLLSDSVETMRVIADSQQEGLAFLATYLLKYDDKLRQLADNVVVFTKPGRLPMLAVGAPGFIPVITHPDVERELAELGIELKAVVVDYRAHRSSQQSITLRPLSDHGFRKALETMALGPDEISRLITESGRSLTVLRRRLAKAERLKRPDWAEKQDIASSLAAMALVGTWLNNNSADCSLIQSIAQCDAQDLDRHFTAVLDIDESPVWGIGEYRGVVSKLDVLYGVARHLRPALFKRFLVIAKLVLSKRNPALDLAEDQRWAATLYGKVPASSEPLRKGIGESLVLLAIHGEHLFSNLVREPGREIENLIQGLLEPLTMDRLLSQCKQLSLYAEAAPDAFLRVFEQDLERDDAVTFELMKPATELWFRQNNRVHLLWALEVLAWNPKWIVRVIDLLARLAEIEPDDNSSNKPSNSLLSIFRSWMPQTGASLRARKAALEYLIRKFPKIAWHILSEQFVIGQQIGGYSPKPLWRDYAIGFGEPVGRSERNQFVQFCIQICIAWSKHTVDTLSDLTGKTEQLDSNQLTQLDQVIGIWGDEAEDKDCSVLRERIRAELGIVKLRVGSKQITQKRANERIQFLQRAYEKLNPSDVVWRHAWLFEKTWVAHFYDEYDDDFEERDERIRNLRIEALLQIRSQLGIEGVIRLAFCGEAPYVTGFTFVDAVNDRGSQISLLNRVISVQDFLQSGRHQQLVSGIFGCLGPERAVSVVENLKTELDDEIISMLLRLIAFDRHVWTALPKFGEALVSDYWREVKPSWGRHSAEDINFAVSQLLAVGRPYAAFDFAHLDWKRVDSIHIQSILLDSLSSTETRQLTTRNDAYHVEQALSELDERCALPQPELARLELLYLDVCRFGDRGIPNLEREIESNPEMFCDAVALTSRRLGGNGEPTSAERRASQIAFRLLGALERVPGHDDEGLLNANDLMNWIKKVQIRCDSLECRNRADYRIGDLLSNAPLDDEDGIWPCRPVRQALDAYLNSDIEDGFLIGRRNARGVELRGHGGDQDRKLAEQYDEWAQGCDYTYPRVAATLRRLAESFRHDGKIWDEDTAVRERLHHW